MSREEFIEKHRHELSGAILDCLFRGAQGGELSLMIRQMLRKIDTTLSQAWQDLQPNPPARK